jgi:hypothetical protein
MGLQCPLYRSHPTLSYLGNRPPYIDLGIRLVAHQGKKEKGNKGDPVHFGVDVIDDNHLFLLLQLVAAGNHDDRWILTMSSDHDKAPKVRLLRLEGLRLCFSHCINYLIAFVTHQYVFHSSSLSTVC